MRKLSDWDLSNSSKWPTEKRLQITENLIRAINHVTYNPNIDSRVNSIVVHLLQQEKIGELTVDELIESTKETALFTTEELKASQKILTIFKLSADENVIN